MVILAPLKYLRFFFERFSNGSTDFYPERWQYLLVQDFAQALPAFQNYLKQTSGLSSDWVGMGLCHYFLKDYPAALDAFNQALLRDIQHEEARLHRSMTFFELKQYPEAVNDLENLFNRFPEKQEYIYALSWTALFVQPQRSLEILDHLPQLQTEAGLLLNAGHAAVLLGDNQQAENFYRQALGLKPQNKDLLQSDWKILAQHGVSAPQEEFAELLTPKEFDLNEK